MRTIDPEHVNRVEKLLVDAGDAPTFEAAAELLRTYRLQIAADESACADPTWQAAMLTAVNTGNRAVHGGVRVKLASDPVCPLPWARGKRLSEALMRLGAEVTTELDAAIPTIAFGDIPSPGGAAPSVRPFAGEWTAGVSRETRRGTPSVLAAVLAAAIAVSECFQWLRGHAVAGDRELAVSLWDPEGGAEGPPLHDLPGALWLLGLGHLGQAYAWLLALLPYPGDGERRLVLQDDDRVSRANSATSMLHRTEDIGVRKTRLVAGAMEELGWATVLVERRHPGGSLYERGDPPVLLGGVDHAEVRRQLDETGFPLIFDAGLGAGPDGFLGMTIRRLPGSRPSRDIWPARAPRAAAARGPAYEALERESGDRCGVELLAGRTVATAFVGVTAACWIIGGLLRELHGGQAFSLVDYSLRDPGRVSAIPAPGAALPRVVTVPCT